MKTVVVVALLLAAAVAAASAHASWREDDLFDAVEPEEFGDVHPAVLAQLEMGLAKRRIASESGSSSGLHTHSRTHSQTHAHTHAHAHAHAHAGAGHKKKGPHITVVSNTNVLNSNGGDDDDDDSNNNPTAAASGVVGENGNVQAPTGTVVGEGGKVTPAAGGPTTPAVQENNGDEAKQKAADEAKQKEEKAKKEKQEQNEKAEAARAEAERVPHAEEIQAAVKTMTIQREWVGCHRRLGGCDIGAGPWGVGRSHGREYFDRIGGGVAQISDCPGEYVVRGLGISRCGNGFFALQLIFTCCRLEVKLA